MSRLKANPQKSTPVDGDLLFGWDSDGFDKDSCFTLAAASGYFNSKLPAASGSVAGTLSAALFTKLSALLTNATLMGYLGELGQQPLGVAIGTPVDGYVGFLINPCAPMKLVDVHLKLASGTCSIDIQINGSSVPGGPFSVSSTDTYYVWPTPPDLASASELGINISGSSSPVALIVSIRGDVQLS